MCMEFGYYPQINLFFFVFFFSHFELSHFQARILSKGIDSGYLVYASLPTVLCRSFWNFTGVFAMVWKCACGLDIILKLIVVTFFRILNLVVFEARILSKCIGSRYLFCATPPSGLCRSFWNFTGVFVIVWKCEYGLDITLRLIFITFFRTLNVVISPVWNTIKVYRQWVPCVRNSSCSFVPIFFKLYKYFCHGLKKMRVVWISSSDRFVFYW